MYKYVKQKKKVGEEGNNTIKLLNDEQGAETKQQLFGAMGRGRDTYLRPQLAAGRTKNEM